MPTLTAHRRGQYRVLLPLGLAMTLSLLGDLTLYAVLPASAQTLGLGLSALGVLLSANRLIRFISNPLAGWCMDRWGRRRLLLTGLALGTLSTLSYTLSGWFWVFLLGRVLWGVSWSLIYVGAYSVVVDITGPEDRGWGSGVLQVFYFCGLSAGPLLGGLLTDGLGFDPALRICALSGALGFVLAWVTLPETLPLRDPSISGKHPRVIVPGRVWTFPRPSLQSVRDWLARNRSILAGDGLYLLSTFIGEGIVLSTLSLYLKQQYGEAISFIGLTIRIASMGGLLLGLRGLVAAFAAPIAGYLSDRGGDRRIVSIAGAAASMAGMALLAWSAAPGTLIAGVLLIALGGGALGAVLPAWVGDLAAPERRGGVMGGLMTAGDVGSAVAPLAAYGLLAHSSLRGIYTASALGLAVGIALIGWASRMPPASQPLRQQLPETDMQG